MRTQFSHSRQVDRLPARDGVAIPGKVLGCDVPCPVQVGMNLVATSPTLEPCAGAAVVASNMPAAATSLRGMPGINPDHRTTPFLSLVLYERTQLGKAPTVKTPGLFTMTNSHPGPDVLQVFQDDCPASWCALNNLLAQHVVAVLTEPERLASELPQVAASALAAALLESATQLEPPGLDVAPGVLAQEASVGGDGGLRQTQVNPDHYIRGRNFRRGNRDHDVQPPPSLSEEQVRHADLSAAIPLRIGGQVEGDSGTPGSSGQADGSLFPVHLEGVDVESRRTQGRPGSGYLASLLEQGQGGPHRFGSLDASLDVEVTHKRRVLTFHSPVGLAVKGDAVSLSVLPAIGADSIEGPGELPCGLGQGLGLLRSRLQENSNRSIHRMMIPYA